MSALLKTNKIYLVSIASCNKVVRCKSAEGIFAQERLPNTTYTPKQITFPRVSLPNFVDLLYRETPTDILKKF